MSHGDRYGEGEGKETPRPATLRSVNEKKIKKSTLMHH